MLQSLMKGLLRTIFTREAIYVYIVVFLILFGGFLGFYSDTQTENLFYGFMLLCVVIYPMIKYIQEKVK